MKNSRDSSRPVLTLLAAGCFVAVVLAAVLFYFAFRGTKDCHECAFYILLIWAVGWLAPTALVTFFIFQLLRYQHTLLAQAVCLIAVAVNLVLIFSVCPMDLWSKPKESDFNQVGLNAESTAAKFLIEENKKVVEVIKDQMAEEDNWFHNKFILVGGLLAATMGYIGFGKQSQQSSEQRLTDLSKSPSTALILALASVLALGIDMHVRGNASEIRQEGLWIRYYLEPVLLHGNSGSDAPNSLPGEFYGWEEFLREGGPALTAIKAVDWHPSTGTGKHSGELWNLFYVPHIHFLTALVYVLYLGVFQTFARLTKHASGFGGRGIPILCFAIVQASFFAFALIAHSAPEMFELKVLPFVGAYEVSYVVPLHYFVPCLALIFLNIPYIACYFGK